MPDASLLTPEVLALVGRESEPVKAVLSSKAVRHAIEVYGGDASRRFAPGDAVPNFAFAALEPDALPVNVPDLLPDSLLVSNEMEFERELRLGEELSLT